MSGRDRSHATHCVIGSGPAGVAAAAALLAAGHAVTMLDAGGDLEPVRQAAVDRLSRRPPEEWDGDDVRYVKGRLRSNAEGAPLKLTFGSDYPYRDVDRLDPVDAHGVDAYRAFAAGGMSVLWGASILPFSDADLDAWPVTAEQLRPHYAAALGMTGLTGADDALARIYPLHARPTALTLSAQARLVAGRAAHHADALGRQGIHVGQARLAMVQPPGGPSCVYCGMCLYGCPYGVIYSSRDTLVTDLMRSDRFRYVPGAIVRRLVEQGDHVLVEAISREHGERRTVEAGRVYLGAGVLGSTAILLRSLGAAHHPVLLRQSDHFLLPLWLHGFHGRAATERLHTLSQLFIEVAHQSVSRHGLHLQLYTYNDFYPRMARRTLGRLYPALAPAAERLFDRTMLIKGYLHSEDSSAIRAILDTHVDAPRLRLDAVPSRRSREIIRAVTALLWKNRRLLGMSPIGLARRTGRPGSGVHVGSSFPMRTRPAEFDSDVHGTPVGFTRVHAIDATVFPTMPAASPTLTIMANAWRIAIDTAHGTAGSR